MLKTYSVLTGLVLSFHSYSQIYKTISQTIDDITYAWDFESSNLDNYGGFKKFCRDKSYRDEVINILHKIHHYDSVIYDRLAEDQKSKHDREVRKTMRDIIKFEEEYDIKSFLEFLNDECIGLHELEKYKNDLEDEIGQESYDGKKYILTTEISKYIHHITRRVDLLREHVHRLHIE